MRDLRHLVAAVALLCVTGCAAGDEDSRVDVPRTPQPGPSDPGGDSTPGADSLVLASTKGVDLVDGDGESVRLSHQPASLAYGVRDNLVAYQGSDSDSSDIYPPRPGGPVEIWADGIVSELPTAREVTSVRLLDAGLINGRPVALVAERFDEGQSEGAAEALVRIDLEDLTRLTVAPRQPAWEAGHQAAHLLAESDVIALYQHGTQVDLVRWSTTERRRAWSVNVAEDRNVDLVASGVSVAVALQKSDKRRGFAPTLTVTRHDPATGEPQDRTVLEVVDPEGAIDTGLSCHDWLTASTMACGRSGGAPIAIAEDGSFFELVGPAGATPCVVQEP